MLKAMILQAALAFGQAAPVDQPGPAPTAQQERVTVVPIKPMVRILAPVVRMSSAALPGAVTAELPKGAEAVKATAAAPQTAVIVECGSSCENGCKAACEIVWLRRWKCDEIELKAAEHKPKCCKGSFLHCPKEEEKKDDDNGEKKNGDNGEKKNGDNGEKKAGDNGNGNGKEEEPATPLMGLLKCAFPGLHCTMEDCGVKTYGWIQGGFTGNLDSPNDRLNYGVNFNNRSNDVMLNQFYIVLEKALDLDKKKDEFHIGFRADLFYGHDSYAFENTLGVFPNFLGDRLEASRTTEMGLAAPQFYVDIHTPMLTERGVDFRIGRQYTPLTYETTPAPTTEFYSHTYEYFLLPFTHLGAWATVHVGDTLDITNGIVRGWDVAFQDNNDSYSWNGLVSYNSCDKRNTVAIAWITGPEQLQNNQNNRTVFTAYYTRKFGCKDQFKFVTGGSIGWEQNGTLDPTSVPRSAEFYSASSYLFYSVNSKLTLGVRGEWFHDDDGNRTPFANSDNGGASFNRPGYAGSFYDLTVGATYKPFKNLRVRPEMRFDWFEGAAINGSASRPYNDQRDKFQMTPAIDVIYEF